MDTQTTLFSGEDLLVAPRARRTDHDSSKIAAKEHKESGRADTHTELVLSAVRRWPGLTSKELAEQMSDYGRGLDRHEVARRLADAERSGLVSGAREPGKQITWLAKQLER